jgi:hypothetical protein
MNVGLCRIMDRAELEAITNEWPEFRSHETIIEEASKELYSHIDYVHDESQSFLGTTTCRSTHNLETRRLGQYQLIWYWSFFVLSFSRQAFQISRDFLPLPSLWTRHSHLCEEIEFRCTTSGKSRCHTGSSS